jgi:hypothetical protein
LGGTCNPDDGTHTPSWRILSNLNNGGAANNISAFQFVKVTNARLVDPILHTVFVSDGANDSLSLSAIYLFKKSDGTYVKIASNAANSMNNAMSKIDYGGSNLILDEVRRKLITWSYECSGVVDHARCNPSNAIALGSYTSAPVFHIFDISSIKADGSVILNRGGANNWRGNWSSSTAYVANDGVFYNGVPYIAKSSSTNVAPSTDPYGPWGVSQMVKVQDCSMWPPATARLIRAGLPAPTCTEQTPCHVRRPSISMTPNAA